MASVIQYRKTTNDLGGTATTNQLSTTALNNLFDDVSPAEGVSGDVEYRALDFFNSGDATAVAVSVYCDGTPNANTDILFALEASPLNSTTAISDESTAPTISGSFATYIENSRLTFPDIAAGAYCRLWIKRIVTAGCPNLANDGTNISIQYA
jgi:hypothetical protein